MTRSTNEILVAIKEDQPVTLEETKLALLALSAILHFAERDRTRLRTALEDIAEGKPLKTHVLRFLVSESKTSEQTLFDAKHATPEKWLGPGNLPGTPEYAQRLAVFKRIAKNATGIEL